MQGIQSDVVPRAATKKEKDALDEAWDWYKRHCRRNKKAGCRRPRLAHGRNARSVVANQRAAAINKLIAESYMSFLNQEVRKAESKVGALEQMGARLQDMEDQFSSAYVPHQALRSQGRRPRKEKIETIVTRIKSRHRVPGKKSRRSNDKVPAPPKQRRRHETELPPFL